jgi:hypothetical protein
MHRIPWCTVLMMINDRSRYRKVKEGEDAGELKTEEEIKDFFHLV